MSDSAVRACFPLTTGPSGRKRARTRSPPPGSNVPPAKRTTQSRAVPVTPPPASPDADDPPLFLVTASPSAIVDDSHYSSFGHGFSYEYHGADLSRHGLGEALVPLGEQASKQESPAAVNLNHLIPVAACFNCGSPGHQLSDCPFVCDQATISASRERFRSEKAELSALGSVPSRRLGAITVGSDSPHQRFLDYADRFKPGVVSDELGSALGYGADADRFVTREYPWMYRILEYGYPRGWTMRAGDQDPFSRIRQHVRRIAQEFGRSDALDTLDDVSDLVVYDGRGCPKPTPTAMASSSQSRPTSRAGSPRRQTSPTPPASAQVHTSRSIGASADAQAEPFSRGSSRNESRARTPSSPLHGSAPLPSLTPPPLPVEPPPPLPVEAPPPDDPPPLIRLVDFRTALFDSSSHWLAFSPEEYYSSFNRPPPPEGRETQRTGSCVETKSSGVSGRGESEAGTEDMDMSSSDESA
ncbi:putative Teichoic acid poly(glycerol phosphate) polymerase, or putative RNA helicase [Rhodotorula taiwanensis]|uniref:Putative Teichoic acid poly(Glycerol phosphate) polymerase, or putative RNA helicase n=1 Tax=Rhodotorula taiwanensis TaxID=741276 RepID=A0A2S5B288_9BASI|nr:putative Teichoic acid poly(glycerol phosphate) polymerase, or putative RNA helicase [Rhodotorula taiwanensis]